VKGVMMINKRKYINAQLQECFDKYRLKLFSYCLSRLNGSREAADDCVQETFIVYYNKLLEGNFFEDPKTFLYRTANNFIKRQKQKDAKEPKHQLPLESAEDVPVTDEEYDARLDLIDYDMFAKMLIDILSDEEKGNKHWYLFILLGVCVGGGLGFGIPKAISSAKQRKEDEKRL